MSEDRRQFLERLRDEVCLEHARPMRRLFDIAKEFRNHSLASVSDILDADEYVFRMAAVCVMDLQAREKQLTDDLSRELFELYLSRHDRIDTWDMVDRAAPHVVGRYLFDKDKDPLYKLARSGTDIEKRTAIVSTWYFIKNDHVDDTFALAEILVSSHSELVALAVGSWVREAGKRKPEALLQFLDRHASSMHRGALRAAIEKLPQELRQRYLKAGGPN